MDRGDGDRVLAAYTAALPYHLRTPQRIAGFFDGLELVEPGVVPASLWRPDGTEAGEPAHVDRYCGLARKP